MHVGFGVSGANAWHDRQGVAAAPRPPRCATATSLAWQLPHTAVPGFLNPSRSKSWQAPHAISAFPTWVWCPGLVRNWAQAAGTDSGAGFRAERGKSAIAAAAQAATKPTTRAIHIRRRVGGFTGQPRDTAGKVDRGARLWS
jgi:hypothetical protein